MELNYPPLLTYLLSSIQKLINIHEVSLITIDLTVLTQLQLSVKCIKL